PTAVGPADEQRAVFGEAHRHHAGAEPRAEREAHSLVAAIDLLQEHAHHRAVRLVADEHLLLEGAELPARQVGADAAGGLAHLPIGEGDGRRDQLRDLLRLDGDPTAALRHLRGGAEVLRLRLLVPAEAVWVADEPAFGDVLEVARTIPRALVVG